MRTLSLIIFVFLGVTALSAQHNHATDNSISAGDVNDRHSLYHLNATWTDHHGETVFLSDYKGSPVIVVMFYGNCAEICPILIRDTWRLYTAVDKSVRNRVNVLAVSFDAENDTPATLLKYAEREQLNISGWHFMTSSDSDIRNLAMMLGVQYSKKSDGHFAHSNLITVLDKNGRITVRIEGLNRPVKEAAAIIDSFDTKTEEQ